MIKNKRPLHSEAKKVVDFINNRSYFKESGAYRDIESSFYKLTEFLKKENLSCIPQYYFYLAGKLNFSDFYFPIEVYYWHTFKMKRIKDIIEKENYERLLKEELDSDRPHQSVIKNYENKLFMLRKASFDNFNKYAWEYIKDEQVTEAYIDSMNSEQERLYNIGEENEYDNNFCEACQNSPCICSDPERTSTIFDD
jgi:hypothetical protein